MSGFTETALEKKLMELNNSQQSIQTLSLWLIHHRKHYKVIIQVWFKELKKAKVGRKLTFVHLANDIIQNSKKKGPEFTKEFISVLKKAFEHVTQTSDPKTVHGLQRVLSVWEERGVYDNIHIEELRKAINGEQKAEEEKTTVVRMRSETRKSKRKHSKTDSEPRKNRKRHSAEKSPVHTEYSHIEDEPKMTTMVPVNQGNQSPAGEPPDPEELIRALQDLENSASTDATVREKIASLPPEVSDATLLEKIQDRESAERLSRQVDEACSLLADYNTRLAQELEDRKVVASMLNNFLVSQREQLGLCEQKLEEYKDKLRKVTQVRNELKSHLQNLPDLTLLPNVTGGLAPLPSAGDLFSQRFLI